MTFSVCDSFHMKEGILSRTNSREAHHDVFVYLAPTSRDSIVVIKKLP